MRNAETTEIEKSEKEKPMTWDDSSIRKAVDNFLAENGRLPKAKEMRRAAGLPSAATIQKIYQVSFGKWLQQNYPPEMCTSWQLQDRNWSLQDLEDIFIKEYNRIHPTAAPTYDANRTNGTPGWQYISRMLGTTTWLGLKAKLEDKLDVVQYERYSHPQNPNTQSFQVYSEIVDYGE